MGYAKDAKRMTNLKPFTVYCTSATALGSVNLERKVVQKMYNFHPFAV